MCFLFFHPIFDPEHFQHRKRGSRSGGQSASYTIDTTTSVARPAHALDFQPARWVQYPPSLVDLHRVWLTRT